MSNDVYIIGVGMIKFGKFLERSIKDMTGQVLDNVLKDCNLTPNDINAAWFSNTMWGLYSFQHAIRGQVALTANGLQGIPITNVENACASASTALHGAWTAVKAGIYDCVLAVGAEKQHDTDRNKVMRSFSAAVDVDEMRRRATQPRGEELDGHSAFMDFYASSARAHMKTYGSTKCQLAVIAAKNHNNSTMNPLAQYTFPQTVEQVLNDRIVTEPLTRAMCAPIGDGAAAAVVCSEGFLKKLGSSRAVKIRASILDGGTRTGTNNIVERATRRAFEQASLGHTDIDVMEVHDATAFGEISAMESLGFCPRGEGGLLAERGDTALDGKIPVNTSGGLISRGHPIGASGLAQIYELVTQLRGEADQRQVRKHRIAMTHNAGGTIGSGEAAISIHILEKT